MPPASIAVVLGVALALAGAGFDSPSLIVAGIGLGGLAVIALFWVELARPRQLVREPAPARVVEGDPYPVRIRAVGARVPPPGGELVDPILERSVRIGPRWGGGYAAEITLTGRGRRRLGPARLEIRDPLGLRTRSVESDDDGELLVLPRVEPVYASGRGVAGSRASALAGLDEGMAATRLDARSIELEVDGLRPYREGSPASRIHWPAVARTGELIERRLVAGAQSAPLVVLDSANPAGGEALDAAVRAAASLCVHLAQAGGCVALLPGDRRPTEIEPDLRAWPHVHARLAVVEAGGPGPVLNRAVGRGGIFWVTATARPALPPALRGPAPGPRYVVAPSTAGAARAAFMVAGCAGTLHAGSTMRRTRRAA